MNLDKKFQNLFLNVAIKAAISSFNHVGKENKTAADKAAVDTMREELNKIEMKGKVVIGEGELEKRVNLNRLMIEINERPASQRATNINVSNNHNFKVEIDEEASKYMFPQNERLK